MNRNWDIMRNSANGADPNGTTRRMEQNRMRDRERFTSRDREEGSGGARWFDGVPDYEQARYGAYRNERNERNEHHERQGHPRQGYVPSYGDEGFGRPSQGWGAQGYGGEYQARGTSRYGGYGYEHGESEALGSGYRQHHEQERGLLGRLEEGIDRAFGNDWDRQERYRGMRDMRGDMRDRDDDHPSLWDRVKGAFTGGSLSGKGPKNWARSDERIREDVCECLTYHPNIDASEIDVTVKDGEVTLVGAVGDRGSKRLAEDIVEDVRGVRDVHNQLRVLRNVQGTTDQTGQTGQTTTTAPTGASGMSTNQAWNQARR